jgi:hypothetical protein
VLGRRNYDSRNRARLFIPGIRDDVVSIFICISASAGTFDKYERCFMSSLELPHREVAEREFNDVLIC